VTETYGVLFVCTGNICRSPTAEIVFRKLVSDAGLSEQIVCDSAGMGDWHVGQQADKRSLVTLRAHDYDGESHRARQWRPSWWSDHDLVVALDGGHADELARNAPTGAEAPLLRDFDPATAGQHLDVPDPYYGGDGGFEDVLEIIERSCVGLLADVRRRLKI
jgi:protein-tyrosine phosphatase